MSDTETRDGRYERYGDKRRKIGDMETRDGRGDTETRDGS